MHSAQHHLLHLGSFRWPRRLILFRDRTDGQPHDDICAAIRPRPADDGCWRTWNTKKINNINLLICLLKYIHRQTGTNTHHFTTDHFTALRTFIIIVSSRYTAPEPFGKNQGCGTLGQGMGDLGSNCVLSKSPLPRQVLQNNLLSINLQGDSSDCVLGFKKSRIVI